MTIKIKKYTAKPVEVEAIQITKSNMAEVAKWCKGSVCTEVIPAEKSATGEEFTEKYVRPKMYRPKNRTHTPRDDEMTKGYVGKWIIKRGTNYKVYTDQAFANNYTDGQALPLAEQKHRDEVSPSIFNGMVQEMTQPRETHLAVSGHETKFVTPSAGVPMRGVTEPPFKENMTEEERDAHYEMLEAAHRRRNGGNDTALVAFTEPTTPNVGIFVSQVPTGFEKPAQ